MVYPIVTGSTALKEYGWEGNPNDCDIIVDENQAIDFLLRCDKKVNGVCLFGNDKVDLVLKNPLKSKVRPFRSASKFIFDTLNAQYALKNEKNLTDIGNDQNNKDVVDLKLIDLKHFGKAILCPLDMLFGLYRGHIHRVLPLTQFQDQNVEIWYKSVEKYLWMKDQLSNKYKNNFDVIFDDQITRNPSSYMEELMIKTFALSFQDTQKIFGDTLISMEKSPEDFFNDNVPRVINHDELHKEIAKLCRNSEELLFEKMQKVGNKSVEMDKDLFFKANHSIRIQLLREEIMVLFLERKWLPMVHFANQKESCYRFDRLDERKEEFLEIVSHFVTNLCGQGHHWLRRYCLDNVDILSDLKAYDFKEMEQLVIKICNPKTLDSALLEKFNISQLDTAFHYNSLEEYFESNTCNKKFHGENEDKIFHCGTCHPDFIFDCVEIDAYNYTVGPNKIDFQFCRHMFQDVEFKILNCFEDVIIFDSHGDVYYIMDTRGFGFEINEKQETVAFFTVQETIDVKKHLIEVIGQIYDTKNEKLGSYKLGIKVRYKTAIYMSSDCTEQDGISYTNKQSFLSSYGTLPFVDTRFPKFIKFLSKKNLHIKNKNEYADEYEYSTSDSNTSSLY